MLPSNLSISPADTVMSFRCLRSILGGTKVWNMSFLCACVHIYYTHTYIHACMNAYIHTNTHTTYIHRYIYTYECHIYNVMLTVSVLSVIILKDNMLRLRFLLFCWLSGSLVSHFLLLCWLLLCSVSSFWVSVCWVSYFLLLCSCFSYRLTIKILPGTTALAYFAATSAK